MVIRKFRRDELDSEPHRVSYQDIYPWDAIEPTPFSSSIAFIEPGGHTMMHLHHPAETFIICRGQGTMTIDGETTAVSAGDVVYLKPRCEHSLRNDSQTEELMFLNVFWNAPEEEIDRTPRMIVPSPPTSNGPLHVGHLAGPYLLADVMRRWYRLRGVEAKFVCLTDDHQSYVVNRAKLEGRPVSETAAHHADQAIAALRMYRAEPDVCVFPSRDPEFRAAVLESFAKLLASGAIREREVDVFVCEGCRRTRWDGFVAGRCPHCREISHGFFCESCCLPNATVDLIDALCVECRRAPSIVKRRRLIFDAAPFLDRIAAHHARIRLSPKLRSLAARMAALPDLTVIASQEAEWGIDLTPLGFAGQIVSPWFEVALAGSWLQKLAPESRVESYFGYDNAFLYLIHDPALSLALDPDAPLASLSPNEYLMIGDRKISTTKQDSDAREVLDQIPAELLRLYLAGVRPELSRTSWNQNEAAHLLQVQVSDTWRSWLADLARSLEEESSSCAPRPAVWSAEQVELAAQMQSLLDRVKAGYQRCSLTEVSWAIHELVHRAVSFALGSSHLARVPSLAAERATGLALELAAVRTLALMIAPLMPSAARQMWRYLGYRTEPEWSDRIQLITPGQPLAPLRLSWDSPHEDR